MKLIRGVASQLSEPPQVPIKFSVKTDNAGASHDYQFSLSLSSLTPYNFTVKWGDGTQSTITDRLDAARTHSYPEAGTYTIEITGTFGRMYFNNAGDKLKVVGEVDLGDGSNGWTSFQNAFYGCANITSVIGVIPDGVTSLRQAFQGTGLTDWSIDMPATITDLYYAWVFVPLTSFTGGGSWAGVTNAGYCAYSANINTTDYNALLVLIEQTNQNNGLSYHFGTSKHSGAGTTARNALVADHSATITDGGPA